MSEFTNDGHVLHLVVDEDEVVDRWIDHPNSCMKTWRDPDGDPEHVYTYPDCPVANEEEGMGVGTADDFDSMGESDLYDLLFMFGSHHYEQAFEWYFYGRYDYWGEYDCEFDWRPVD